MGMVLMPSSTSLYFVAGYTTSDGGSEIPILLFLRLLLHHSLEFSICPQTSPLWCMGASGNLENHETIRWAISQFQSHRRQSLELWNLFGNALTLIPTRGRARVEGLDLRWPKDVRWLCGVLWIPECHHSHAATTDHLEDWGSSLA